MENIKAELAIIPTVKLLVKKYWLAGVVIAIIVVTAGLFLKGKKD